MARIFDKECSNDEYQKQIFDLQQLLEISKSLNSTLDYTILIDSILLTIMGQMQVLNAALFARKGLDSGWFNLHRNFQGFDVEHGVDYAIAEDAPVIQLFAREYRPYTLDEIRERLGDLGGLEHIAAMNPDLVLPLKAKGVVNGFIIIGNRILDEAFNDYEREFLLNIAILAAIAINNAFLFEMTTTDMMTKLRMKHYFYTVLIEKIDACTHAGASLAVIMIDIDHFKKFNDDYGHSCGDDVLKQTAGVIQAGIRVGDLAARYGGEEFCILLPATDLAVAGAVADRIRIRVAAAQLDHEGHVLSVTISLGVAQFDPVRDLSARTLLDRADKALYQAKRNGRNRVVLAE
jgi:diguanylate cyclase (GGDEF)-like protein